MEDSQCAPDRPLVVVKVGGSVITKKRSGVYCPDFRSMEIAASELASVVNEFRLIVVHGGGSYGHLAANTYMSLGGGALNTKVHGIHSYMEKLSTLFSIILEEEGIKVLKFPPINIITLRGGRISKLSIGPLMLAISSGLTALLHGDVCFDVERGFSILSGDSLASFLARRLGAVRLVFGMEVDGIYEEYPRGLLKVLNVDKCRELIRRYRLTGTDRVDVTGGIRLKLKEGLKASEAGTEVYFVNAKVPCRLSKAIAGDRGMDCTILPAVGR